MLLVKKLHIPFDEYTFRYFNIETNQFEIEGGEYQIMVGPSSVELPLCVSMIMESSTSILISLPNYDNGTIKQVSPSEFELLLGRPIPDSHIKFYKKNRLIAHENTTIEELRYARGWFGRFFAAGVRFIIGFLRFIGKRHTAAVLSMGILQQPLRGLSRMSGGMISWDQLQAMMQMINGHFFIGLKEFIKASKQKRVRHRRIKKGLVK